MGHPVSSCQFEVSSQSSCLGKQTTAHELSQFLRVRLVSLGRDFSWLTFGFLHAGSWFANPGASPGISCNVFMITHPERVYTDFTAVSSSSDARQAAVCSWSRWGGRVVVLSELFSRAFGSSFPAISTCPVYSYNSRIIAPILHSIPLWLQFSVSKIGGKITKLLSDSGEIVSRKL